MSASAAFLAAQSDPPGRVGRLNYIDGPVSFQPDGVNDWVDASINRPLIPGDNIWVGDRARSELHIGSTALRLGSNTAFQFLNLDDQVVQIRLSEGTLSVRLRNLGQHQVFEIDTPNLAFTLERPGEYRIDANPDSQTNVVLVRDGQGEVTGDGEAFPVYARQQVLVRGDDQISYNLTAAPGPDQWDQWCSSRDQREDRSQSARFVSREVDGYEDLDQYGRWDNQPGYGNVWMPTSVAVGWAPYNDGHWAWIAPWGWTWVDEAPWGFAPYHYGRWASFGGRWGWIPGPYDVTPVYAPALVGWIGGGGGGGGFSLSFSIGTAAAVGWFPLGPREPYFPSYQASQGYFTRVNTSNTVINNVTINNYYASSRNSNNTATAGIRYANQNVQNAVTAVPQSTFARGGRVRQDSRPVPQAQLASVRVTTNPTIAPQRESVLGGRADTASRAPRPPANVLTRPVVARTAPPARSVPFDQQQPALAQNPGRPLPNNRGGGQQRQSNVAPSAPVRVVDMNRVKRVQPTVGAGPQGGAPAAVNGPQNVPPGQQRRQPQQATPPQAAQPQPAAPEPPQNGPPGQRRRQDQQTAPAQAAQPQPAPQDRQNVPPGQQRRQQPQQDTPPQAGQPQAPPADRQNGPPGQQRRQQPQQDTPPQAAQPQAPPADRQNGPPGQQRRQQQAPPPQAAQPQPVAPQAVPPPQERRQQQAPPVQAAPPPPQPQQPAAVPQRAPEAPKQNPQQNKGKGKQDKSGKEDDNKGK